MISIFRRYLETWPVRLFFLLMVASFVLWGVGDMLRYVGTSTWVAKVGSTTIEQPSLDTEYRRALSTASRDLPSGQEASQALRQQVVDETLQRMIGQAAVAQELQNLHIVVPQAVLVDTIRNLAMFKNPDGSFDKARLDAVLRNQNLTEAGFLDLVRGDIARQQLMDAVTAGSHVPEVETAPIYASHNEKRSADIAPFPLAAIADPPMPDDATARRWYDNHPDQYATPEYRRVTAIVLSPATLAPEIGVTDQELQAAYADHQADYSTIAKRSAEVISTTDESRATALANQWKAGADWAAMQAAAQAQGAAAIEQNDATRTQFPDPDLARAVFAATPEAVSDPIKGALGWFVIRVTRAVAGGTTPFEQVRDKLRQRVVTEKALGLVYDKANKIDNDLGNGTALTALPSDPGIVAGTATFDKDGTTPDDTSAPLPGEPEIRTAIVAAAFAAQKGDPPRLTEVQTPSTGGSGYYALTVDDIVPSGEKPFDAVHAQVNEDWRADQRRHGAEQAAAAMLQTVRNGTPFSDAARDAGVTPALSPLVTRDKPDPGMPPEVQQVLFSLKKGEPTMVETGEGFLVAVPVEVVAPDPGADQGAYTQLRAAVAKTVSDDLTELFAEALRLRANPRINQANVDQIVQP